VRYSGAEIETRLSVEELGAIFKGATQSMYGIGAKLGHGARGMTSYGEDGFHYFTPQGDGFEAIASDPPTFEIAVHIPTFSYTAGGSVVLHMYVWDRGTHRQLRFVAPHGMVAGTKKSRRQLEKLISAVQAGDPGAKISR
jgi:hypothetical protein